MEGRKEAFRMYLEQTGTTDALTKVLIKLYDLKDKRPEDEDVALQFMKDNLSNDFPTQADYDKLLEEVEISRKKVEEIQKAEEEAKQRAEVEREMKNMEKAAAASAKTADSAVKADDTVKAGATVNADATVNTDATVNADAFIPGMSNDQLEKLKADVEAELKLLVEDNVKGRYLDVDSVDDKEKTILEQRHLLFQSENEQLKAAGVSDFSTGRAIFSNDNRNLVVWVNEEEHLKFIATGMDSIKETFIRLRTVVENCEFLTFKTKTFCPTFLDPAMHVSVVVKCHNVAARGKMEDKAKTLKICVKPTNEADEFELTNKPKLDMTEFEAMKEFIDEVRKFLEDAHIETTADAVARLEALKALTPQPRSLLAKHLTTNICDELKRSDEPTEKSFLNCIRLGLEEEKLPIGIYAADHDAYKKFAKIFEPILTEYYGLTLDSIIVSHRLSSFLTHR